MFGQAGGKMTKSKEEMAREWSLQNAPYVNHGMYLEKAFLAGYEARQAEIDEQCRLNGIGASRELALMAQVNELLEFKKQAIKVVKFYGDRENWKFISYASDAKDVIRFDDVGCKSYCEDADFAIGSGGRRSREFLSKWGEK